LREIGEIAQTTGASALFLIDEMQTLTPLAGGICIAFQAISRHGLPVAMVAAGLPDLHVRLMSAKPYADRLFSYHELGRLPNPAVRAALIAPAAPRGVDYQQNAARHVVREAAGYPTSSRNTASSYGTTPRPHRSRPPTSKPSTRW
jgi:hypothetical protein